MTSDEFNDIVKIVEKQIRNDPKLYYHLKSCRQNELIRYHHTLGRSIRYEFKLWDREWKPDISNGIDISPRHPEQVSMSVIEKVWENIQSS
jgi:hypothetical protein